MLHNEDIEIGVLQSGIRLGIHEAQVILNQGFEMPTTLSQELAKTNDKK